MTHLHAPLLEDSSIQRQIERETEAIHQGVLNYREMVEITTARGAASGLVPVQRLMTHWYKPFRKAIQIEQRRCLDYASNDNGRRASRSIYGPAIRLLRSDYVAVITMGCVMRELLLEPGGHKFARIAYAIGRDVLAEANIQLLRHDHRGMSKELRKAMEHMPARDKMAFRQENITNLEMLTKACRMLTPRRVNWWAKKVLDDPVWSRKVCVSMGSALAWHMLMTANCTSYGDDFVPALTHEKRKEKSGRKWKTIGYLSLTEQCFNVIDEGHARRETMRPRYVPMVTPPVRWEKDRGGYYVTKTPLVARTCQERADLIHSCEDKMQPFFAGVDALNRVPVQINPFILDVQQRLYASGGGVAGVPLRDDPPMPSYTGMESEGQKKQIKSERAKVHRQIKSLRGERVMIACLHNIASEMAEHDAFYQVHQADFRGRCYPVQPILTHQGSDLARSLYRFSRPVKVMESGRWWMRVAMADLWGIRGVSHNEAAAIVESSMSEIERWAHDPMRHDGWARKYDGSVNKKKAFQALAMAHALTDDDAGARIPIQQDGTCNGMQHYAAMGRDEKGGRATNLTPSSASKAPNSVYVDVANAVLPMIEDDARKGDTLAELILDRITLDHQCAKQVVMPAVYGMTAVGARKALFSHLDEVGITDETRYKVSMYLGRRILNDALREVCASTVETMDWLKSVATVIARKGKRPLRWTTPLGFPVIQTYRNRRSIVVSTLAQELTLRIEDPSLPIRVGRQIDGFAPNFVHSIDASHMLMTAIYCDRKHIDLLCIHDSFATHAQQSPQLGEVLRRTFINMHRHPLLAELHAELQRLNPDLKLPEPPAPGTLDIEEVEDAYYLFA